MPISDCQVRDPRIRRTRKLLQGALGTLMQSKSFDEISVQDITDVATLNRATFYDHYTDKFALLDAMVAGGFHELLNQRGLRYEIGCPGALSAIILATCDYLTWAHSAGGCERQTAFQPLMDAAMVAAIRRLLLEGLERSDQGETGNRRRSRELGYMRSGAAVVFQPKSRCGRDGGTTPSCTHPAHTSRGIYSRVTNRGCSASSSIAIRASVIGSENRRGPALPGFR